ncbi:hypothetical protein GQ457_18G002810 [Hibiscus cannabinus]
MLSAMFGCLENRVLEQNVNSIRKTKIAMQIHSKKYKTSIFYHWFVCKIEANPGTSQEIVVASITHRAPSA